MTICDFADVDRLELESGVRQYITAPVPTAEPELAWSGRTIQRPLGLGDTSMREIWATAGIILGTTATLIGCTANGGPQPPGGDQGAGPAACLSEIVGGNTAVSATTDTLCLSCSVDNPANVVDLDDSNFAQFNLMLAALTGSAQITVTAQPGVVFPAGGIAGYTLSVPAAAVLAAQALPSITINTLNGGTQQETTTFTQVLSVDVAGLIANNAKFFLGLKTTKDFDAVQIVTSPTVAGALATLDVYTACSTATGVGSLAPAP